MQRGRDMQESRFPITNVMRTRPNAIAEIKGNPDYPELSGYVKFYQTVAGVIVYAEISGLPYDTGECEGRVFGLHIHEGFSCTGTPESPLSNTGGHYNPGGCGHLYHAGDLPSIFSNRGFALSLFLTDRFSVKEVIGRTVVVHEMPDNFATQPSGNTGAKIACGVIVGT